MRAEDACLHYLPVTRHEVVYAEVEEKVRITLLIKGKQYTMLIDSDEFEQLVHNDGEVIKELTINPRPQPPLDGFALGETVEW